MRVALCAALLSGAVFAQTGGDSAKFEAADVRVSPHTENNFNIFMRGPQMRAGRYEIRTATMLDLVRSAYGMDSDDKVQGGPNWLEMDRYDVIAKTPEHATPDNLKTMLQNLLADRFHLLAHNESKPIPAYTLTAPHAKLKPADPASTAQKGCRGKPQTPDPGAIPHADVTCHDVSMAEFATNVRNMAGAYIQKPVVDATELKGSFDFDLNWTPRAFLGAAGADGISIFDAVDHQLGLKLDLQSIPTPVVVVDSVDEKPAANPPDTEKLLPGLVVPTEFEVATVKPTPPEYQGTRFQLLPSGQINLQGVNLKLLIQQAWGIFSDDMLAGAPTWLDSERFDIVAKAPGASMVSDNNGPNGRNIDFDDAMVMVKNLLASRFKMQSHMEERPVNAYSLVAVKPKLKPADPNGRIHCGEGPGANQRDPRDKNPVLVRLINCQNMTMARFADMLQGLAPGYIHTPVLDATGLAGGYDFTLNFSTVFQTQGLPGGRGGNPAAAATDAASDPNGAVALPDAIQKQLGLKLEMTKRPVKVLVIDHIEQKPTEN